MTINKDAGFLQKFSTTEVQQFSLEKLVTKFIMPALVGNDLQIYSSSLNAILTNTSNTTASVKIGSISAFSHSAVTSLGAEMDRNNINGKSAIVVNPDYWWNLVSNLGALGNQAGANAIQTGQPDNPYGFPVLKSNLVSIIGTMSGSATLGAEGTNAIQRTVSSRG